MSVIKLTRQSSVPVHFVAEATARQGPLTIGQLNVLMWITSSKEPIGPISRCINLPGTASVEDVTDSLAILITRHEVLRTSFVVGPQPYQCVPSLGTLMVDIFSVEDNHQANRVDIEAELTKCLAATTPTQPAEHRLADPQLRVALATRADVVCAGLVEFSHMAVDRIGTSILEHELAQLIRDPAARIIGPPRHQPLDQAELERSERAAQKLRRSHEYWRNQVAVMPSPLYLMPSVEGGLTTDMQADDAVAIEMSSAATALAVQGVVARTRSSRASCLLAALCAVLSARTGYHELVLPVMSSNRFESHLYDYVGPLAQTSVAAIDVGSVSFDELVRQAESGMLKACIHGTYDVYQFEKSKNQIAYDRGVCFCFEPVYNCTVIETGVPGKERVPPPEYVSAMLSRTRLYRYRMPRLATPVRFDVFRLDGEVILRGWSSDLGRVPAEHVESLLRAMERLVVAAAHGNLDHERIRDAVQIEPIRRDPNWVLNDSQWVELTEIQRLLNDAFAPAKARIFAQAGGESLVAYVAASESIRTPEQAHARCMAVLPARPAAMTPRRYVICEVVPADLDDLAGWRKAVSAGTGRSSGHATPRHLVNDT